MAKTKTRPPPLDGALDPTARVIDEYERLAREAYLLMRGTRLGELRGVHRQRRFNEHGLDPISVTWGQLQMLSMALPADVAQGLEPDPVLMRSAAYADAEDQFRQEVRDGDW